MSYRPPSPDNKRRINKRMVLVGILLATNLGVIFYHGDPRNQLVAKGQIAPVPDTRPSESISAVTGKLGSPEEFQIFAGVRSPGPIQRVARISLRRGQTVAAALVNAGISGAALTGALLSLQNVLDFRKLRAGDLFKAHFDARENLVQLDWERSATERVRASLQGSEWKAGRLNVPTTQITSVVHGTIQNSLWDALISQGEAPKFITGIVDVFAWDIDFYSEVYPGDTFRVLVEKRYVNGQLVDYGKILAAEYVSAGHRHQAFLQTGADGSESYYDENGESLKKQLLKSPLQYGHVTSGYGMRFHPVLGFNRAHNGVDYGVPTGTPVWSVGDGVVTRAGSVSGYGKLIEIKHANGWLSQYAHLSKIDVRVGQRVRQKEFVGLTGQTGLATGPHLHYGLKRQNSFVNPAAQKFEKGKALNGTELEEFRKQVVATLEKLNQTPVADATAVATPKG